jgi:hypothetical protein
MILQGPDLTAVGAAYGRALHVILDDPLKYLLRIDPLW